MDREGPAEGRSEMYAAAHGSYLLAQRMKTQGNAAARLYAGRRNANLNIFPGRRRKTSLELCCVAEGALFCPEVARKVIF